MMFLRAAILAASFAISSASFAQTGTDIRPAPGGTRLLFVDGNDIRPVPGGKRLLFVDGDDIRPEPGGKRLLFVDGDDVRPEPGGLRLLFIDGQNIRRTPGSERLLFIDGNDIRPAPGGPRLYFIDGPRLTRAQLIAVLYTLKPELFKLTKEQEQAQIKARAEAAAEVAAAARLDKAVGSFSISAFSSSDDTKRAGKVVIQRKEEYYTIQMKYEGAEPWEGVAIKKGDELWGAIGPAGETIFSAYQIKGGSLSGMMIAADAVGDASKFGSATLIGAAEIFGEYKFSGKAAKTGVAASGTAILAPQSSIKLEGPGEARGYLLAYELGDAPMNGAGFRTADLLIAAATTGADCAVVKFGIESAALVGDFFSSSKAKGYYTLVRD